MVSVCLYREFVSFILSMARQVPSVEVETLTMLMYRYVCVFSVLTAAPLLCKCVIQRVRARAYGGTILAVLGTGQEAVAQL